MDWAERAEWACVLVIAMVVLATAALAWGMAAGHGVVRRWHWAEAILCEWFARCHWPLIT